MDENRKTYSVIGKVEIGTDEYRDLIEEKSEALRDKSNWYNKYWEESSKVSKLQKELEEVRAELEKYKEFIKKNTALINEDSITLFATLLGE